MRVMRYARDLRPECGMAPDRTLAIDRVASHPRQTGLINPRQQPSLALLTSSSERTKAPGRPTECARFVDTPVGGLPAGQVLLITFTLSGLSTVFEVVTQRATIILSGAHF